jgi:DNA polymerase III alpha subunit
VLDDPREFNESVKKLFAEYPSLQSYEKPSVSVAEFDKKNQLNWYMPDKYKNLDIVEWIVLQCKTDREFQRVEQELILYQKRDLFDLLRFMKYFVDTMRKNNVVWGVGRGSSVSSYILFLIGVHKINSIQYELDVTEFLK